MPMRNEDRMNLTDRPKGDAPRLRENQTSRFGSNGMDFARKIDYRKRRMLRIIYGTLVVMILGSITYGLSRLKPAAPTVERSTIWTNDVRRGDIPREVRGNGILAPEQIQWVQAETDGRVERILALAGAEVKADTVLLELSNAELVQAAFDVEWQLKAAEAQLTKLKVQIESDRLTQEANIASLKADYTQAQLEAAADEELAKDGLVPKLVMQRSRAKADELKARYDIEVKRLSISAESAQAQLAVQQADLEKLRAQLQLKRRQVASLHVKAGFEGVLQQLGDKDVLQVGQRVSPGATLAKVVQPSKLKAEIKIPETQAKDITLGLPALIDTRNGIIPGRVSRVDPAVQNGTVTVDVQLTGALPRGARPDLSVDGTIELERLNNVLYVMRPMHGQSDSTVGLFKLVDGGKAALRVPVKLGRSSVNTIEVLEGLKVGDVIILSDMSQWDGYDRIRLK